MTDSQAGGGPAFPFEYKEDGRDFVHPGMSLRDWFAGQALAGLRVRPASQADRAAADAYRFAAAMLAARKAEEPRA